MNGTNRWNERTDERTDGQRDEWTDGRTKYQLDIKTKFRPIDESDDTLPFCLESFSWSALWTVASGCSVSDWLQTSFSRTKASFGNEANSSIVAAVDPVSVFVALTRLQHEAIMDNIILMLQITMLIRDGDTCELSHIHNVVLFSIHYDMQIRKSHFYF